MQNNNEIIIPLLASLAAHFVSGDAAKHLGPFIGVFLGAFAGSMYYVGRKDKMTPVRWIRTSALLVFAGVILTLPIVEILQVVLNQVGISVQLPKSTGIPVAFIIAAFPEHIMDVLLKFKEKYGKPAKLD